MSDRRPSHHRRPRAPAGPFLVAARARPGDRGAGRRAGARPAPAGLAAPARRAEPAAVHGDGPAVRRPARPPVLLDAADRDEPRGPDRAARVSADVDRPAQVRVRGRADPRDQPQRRARTRRRPITNANIYPLLLESDQLLAYRDRRFPDLPAGTVSAAAYGTRDLTPTGTTTPARRQPGRLHAVALSAGRGDRDVPVAGRRRDDRSGDGAGLRGVRRRPAEGPGGAEGPADRRRDPQGAAARRGGLLERHAEGAPWPRSPPCSAASSSRSCSMWRCRRAAGSRPPERPRGGGERTQAHYARPEIQALYRSDGELTAAERALVHRYLPPASPVLDVGTGAGRVALSLARDGFEVAGVDVSEPMLDDGPGQRRAPRPGGRVGARERRDAAVRDGRVRRGDLRLQRDRAPHAAGQGPGAARARPGLRVPAARCCCRRAARTRSTGCSRACSCGRGASCSAGPTATSSTASRTSTGRACGHSSGWCARQGSIWSSRPRFGPEKGGRSGRLTPYLGGQFYLVAQAR